MHAAKIIADLEEAQLGSAHEAPVLNAGGVTVTVTPSPDQSQWTVEGCPDLQGQPFASQDEAIMAVIGWVRSQPIAVRKGLWAGLRNDAQALAMASKPA
jgi:hypothetical protein